MDSFDSGIRVAKHSARAAARIAVFPSLFVRSVPAVFLIAGAVAAAVFGGGHAGVERRMADRKDMSGGGGTLGGLRDPRLGRNG